MPELKPAASLSASDGRDHDRTVFSINTMAIPAGKRRTANYFVRAKAGESETDGDPHSGGEQAERMTNQVSDTNVSLEALVSRAERAGKGAPPVERWNPAFCGDIDMVIAADGTWLYQGTPIRRDALKRLFSSVLRKDEDGRTYLVTPVEKLGIIVEDAPFLAVEMSREERSGGRVLTFRTDVGDVIEAGVEHPIRFSEGSDAFRPYLLVRGRLEAALTRALAIDLADLVEEDEAGYFVTSNGVRFDLPAGVA